MPRPASASSLEDWMEQGRCLRDEWNHLRRKTTDLMFKIGDWWNTGERQWPHESSQMMDEFSYWQITKFASIAGRVPIENRLSHDNLSIEHFRAVAVLPPESQPEALEIALDDGLSAAALKLRLAVDSGATAVVATCTCDKCGREHRPL